MITYWSFSDALIQTYTLPYLKIMLDGLAADSRIYLVTLEKTAAAVENRVEGYPGIINLPFGYLPFGFSASLGWLKNILALRKHIRQQRIDTIHAFCTPAGMIGYLLSRLTGKPLVLDSYEPHAEAMVENGEWKKNSWSYKLLFYFEKKQTQRAKHVIAATTNMRHYAAEKYGVTLTAMFVKPACVDLNLFSLGNRKKPALLVELGLEGKIVCVYAGKFGGIYLKEEVFDFYKACYAHWGSRFTALILTSHTAGEIESLARQAGLPDAVFRVAFVPHALIPDYIGLGDFAITPVKPVPTKKYCTPIKDGEYWALGLPVVIPKNISIDSDLIGEHDLGYVLQGLTAEEYAKAARHIDNLLKDPLLAEKIRKLAEQERNYATVRSIYAAVYAS